MQSMHINICDRHEQRVSYTTRVSSLRIHKRFKDWKAKATQNNLTFFQSILSVFVSVISAQIKAPADKHVLVILNYVRM